MAYTRSLVNACMTGQAKPTTTAGQPLPLEEVVLGRGNKEEVQKQALGTYCMPSMEPRSIKCFLGYKGFLKIITLALLRQPEKSVPLPPPKVLWLGVVLSLVRGRPPDLKPTVLCPLQYGHKKSWAGAPLGVQGRGLHAQAPEQGSFLKNLALCPSPASSGQDSQVVPLRGRKLRHQAGSLPRETSLQNHAGPSLHTNLTSTSQSPASVPTRSCSPPPWDHQSTWTSSWGGGLPFTYLRNSISHPCTQTSPAEQPGAFKGRWEPPGAEQALIVILAPGPPGALSQGGQDDGDEALLSFSHHSAPLYPPGSWSPGSDFTPS